MLIEHPYKTKCLTSIITFGGGDVICQLMEKYSDSAKRLDYWRVFRQASFGLFLTPYLHLQYNIIIPRFFPSGSRYSLVKILCYDQTVNATVAIIFFFLWIDFLTGKSFGKSVEETRIKLLPTLIANWKLWPAAQVVTFTVMPIPYRVFWANIVGLVWNVYLSYMQNVRGKELTGETPARAKAEQNKLI